MKKEAILKVAILFLLFSISAFAGTTDQFSAKAIFDKINSMLNDTYLSAIVTIGLLWKGYSVWKESGDLMRAAPFGVGGAALGSLAAVAKAVSGALI
jgi:hypothetical protein